MIAMGGGIVKYDKRVPAHLERECIRDVDNPVRGDTLRGGDAPVMVLSVNHPEDVELCSPLGRDASLLPGQLPATGNVSPGTDVAPGGTVEGNKTVALLPFKFLQLFVLVIIALRQGDSPQAFPYTPVSCANADKKRLRVRSLASCPVACCQTAPALRTRCLSCSMAVRTGKPSVQSITGFRPRPERVCRPVMPSDRRRFIHAFTDTKLMSVSAPAFAEDWPSALSRTARQRMRKQWHVPARKPFERSTRWTAVNSNFFIFPITNRICYERKESINILYKLIMDIYLKGINFAMIKKNNNIKFKKKGNQSATCHPVQGRLIFLFSAGWPFLEIKNLYKNLTCIIKVLRFISSPFFSFSSFQKTKV
jgi:hypothetical protein